MRLNASSSLCSRLRQHSTVLLLFIKVLTLIFIFKEKTKKTWTSCLQKSCLLLQVKYSHGVCKIIILIEAERPTPPLHVTVMIISTDVSELCSQCTRRTGENGLGGWRFVLFFLWLTWMCLDLFFLRCERCIVCILAGYIFLPCVQCYVECYCTVCEMLQPTKHYIWTMWQWWWWWIIMMTIAIAWSWWKSFHFPHSLWTAV